MKVFNCDFHVHTCLSPCADLDMHPGLIVSKALEANIDILAVCDHNSSENVRYVIKASQDKNITILPGMELTTKEEAHILAIFDKPEDLAELQAAVYKRLPGKNNENIFGMQVVANEHAEVEFINDRLLIGATDFSLNEAVLFIHKLNGLVIAAHINRKNFSVLSQLGFIDETMNFDALEISGSMDVKEARIQYREINSFSFIKSSDAHYPDDIGCTTTKILMDKPSLSELRMAFNNKKGRRILE